MYNTGVQRWNLCVTSSTVSEGVLSVGYQRHLRHVRTAVDGGLASLLNLRAAQRLESGRESSIEQTQHK